MTLSPNLLMPTNKSNKNILFVRDGFTVVELVIVIGIIGIILAVLIYSITEARKTGRDNDRIAQMQVIRLALEYYHDNCAGQYPVTLSTSANNGCQPSVTLQSFLPVIPADPLNGQPFRYWVGSGNYTYHLGISLEKNHNILGLADKDADKTDGFNGADGGKCNGSDAGLYCYDTISPQ